MGANENLENLKNKAQEIADKPVGFQTTIRRLATILAVVIIAFAVYSYGNTTGEKNGLKAGLTLGVNSPRIEAVEIAKSQGVEVQPRSWSDRLAFWRD